MEDKELQELLEAGRTVEANRRRQAELRRLLEARAAGEQPAVRRKTVPLWPVWTSAAAAAVALLLILRPFASSHTDNGGTTLVAEAELPAAVVETPQAVEPQATPAVTKKPKPRQTAVEPVDSMEQNNSLEYIEPIEPINYTEPIESTEETLQEKTIETPAPERRVMRRTSSIIACTEGCKAPEGSEGNTSRNVHINFFSNDNYADATIYSFPINK